MPTARMFLGTVAGAAVFMLPAFAFAQTLIDHPAPALPPGAKAGVVSSVLASSTASSTAAVSPHALRLSPLFGHPYLSLGILLLLALAALGFFLQNRKKTEISTD